MFVCMPNKHALALLMDLYLWLHLVSVDVSYMLVANLSNR